LAAELGITELKLTSYVSRHTIAKEIAKRDKARIVLPEMQALNMLGLSTQIVMNAVYLTDGSSRRINIDKRKGILLKHTAPKNKEIYALY
jgi:hypothetical protein